MLLKELLKNIKVYETSGEIDNVDISSLTLDNRKCSKGSAFFAIKGLVNDGHRYIGSAAENGAVAAFVEEFTCDNILQIKVKDTRSAMSLAAAAFYGDPARRMRFIGVTGTNGKTSITFMLKTALETRGMRVGVIGTSGIYAGDKKLEIAISTSTTPDPIELQYILSRLADAGVEVVVMEVTAQALHLRKVEDIYYDAAVFTNLTQDHLEFFGTMEVYAGAKKKLFTAQRSNYAVINTDDAVGLEIAQSTDCRLLTYSVDGNTDLSAQNVQLGARGCEFELCTGEGNVKAELGITGLFNLYNALGAIGALMAFGFSAEEAAAALKQYKGTPGRFELPDMHGLPFSVVIDYAHTPDGLENILKTVAGYKKGRLIAVFGCGGNRDTKKRPIMGKIAAQYSDFCVLTSDNPRFENPDSVIDQIEAGIPEGYTSYTKIENRYNAIKYAMQNDRKDDIIVIAGKGDEDYQEIKGIKHHFSDREAVAEIRDTLK